MRAIARSKRYQRVIAIQQSADYLRLTPAERADADRTPLSERVARIQWLLERRKEDSTCIECDGTGKLTCLGGDWGKTPDTIIVCWKCRGSGKV